MEGQKAVALIDMQDHFLKLHNRESKDLMIESQSEILNYCAEKDLPVLAFEYEGNGETIPELYSLVKEVPRNFVFKKSGVNGLLAPSYRKIDNNSRENYGAFKAFLDLDIAELFFMGVNKGACVRYTARSALERGAKIYSSSEVISNVSDRGPYYRDDDDIWFEENGVYRPNSFWKDFCPDAEEYARFFEEQNSGFIGNIKKSIEKFVK